MPYVFIFLKLHISMNTKQHIKKSKDCDCGRCQPAKCTCDKCIVRRVKKVQKDQKVKKDQKEQKVQKVQKEQKVQKVEKNQNVRALIDDRPRPVRPSRDNVSDRDQDRFRRARFFMYSGIGQQRRRPVPTVPTVPTFPTFPTFPTETTLPTIPTEPINGLH